MRHCCRRTGDAAAVAGADAPCPRLPPTHALVPPTPRHLTPPPQLSLGGKLALAFGALMGKLWAGGVGAVSPKLFKWQLAKFAPQFSGYAQQDSQELLAFLLDGLHEVGAARAGGVLALEPAACRL